MMTTDEHQLADRFGLVIVLTRRPVRAKFGVR